MSAEALWQEYQECHDSHESSLTNIETLSQLYEDEYEMNELLDQMEESKRSLHHVRKRIRDLISENDDEINITSKRMAKISKELMQKGYDVDAYYAKRVKLTKEDNSWREAVNVKLEKERPCMRIVDNVLQPIQYGASGYKGVEADTVNEVDILVEDDDDEYDEDDDLTGVPKVNVYREEDDANDVDEAYSTNELAINIGTYFLKPKFCFILKPHQREAVVAVLKQFGKGKNGFLLAHAMGLGKSLTTIACFEAMHKTFKKAKLLMLCPKSLTHSWYSECTKWDEYISFAYHVPLEKPNMDMLYHWKAKGGLLIMTQERFRNYQLGGTFFFEPDIVAVDEAHTLRNRENLFYKAVSQIETNRKLLLTGTPLQNHIHEYFTMIDLIDASIFKDVDFKTEYASAIDRGALSDAQENHIIDAKTKINVFARLSNHVVHRASELVLTHSLLPKHEYKITYHIPLKELPDMKGMGPFQKTSETAKAGITQKIQLCRKLLKGIRKAGDLTLIFSKSVEVVLQVGRAVNADFIMTGATDSQDRKRYVHGFMTDSGDGAVFCMTTRVGGFGLNLFRANRIIILDPTWNPVIDRQACFRAYRYGQQKEVTIYRFIAADTIEENIYRRAVHKTLCACRVIDEQDVERLFTNDQLTVKDDFEEASLLREEVVDDALQGLMNDYNVSVSEHDVLFAEANNEKLTDKQQASAENHYNQIVYDNPTRKVIHPVTQLQVTVTEDQWMFENESEDDNLIVPPYTPVWKLVTSGSKFRVESFKPKPSLIKKYVYEIEFIDTQETQTREITLADMDKQDRVGFLNVKSLGASRLRVKMVLNHKESAWSAWSAVMYP